MSSTFPGPVLSVAVDVVRHLEGEESLPVLWNLFTKCKKSLKDGHRLENMSWRLWYKSMAVPNSAPYHVPSAKALAAKEVLREKAYRPPTPEELPLLPPITRDSTSNVPLFTQGITKPTQTLPLPKQSIDSISLSAALSLSPSLSRKLSSPPCRRNSVRKGSTPVRVGKILCELLPTATIPSISSLTPVPNTASTLSTLASSPPQSGDPRVSPSVTLPLSSPLSHFANSPTMITTAKEKVCPTISLPTPEVEQDQLISSLVPVLPMHSEVTAPPSAIPVITTNHSSPIDNLNEPLSDNRDRLAALPPPPRLVVVNPTPNPTPHPTPPTTPVLHPPVGHVQEEGGVVTASSVPLLRVPGQDALIQAQARAKCNSKLRLLAHEVVDEGENQPSFGTDSAYSPTSEASRPEEVPSAIPPPASEKSDCTVNPNRQSISSDTTSSSSQQSSVFTPSEYSKATTATTISEPFQYPQLGKRRSPSAHPTPTNSVTGLSPTSPSYDSESTQALMPPAPKRRKEKDAAPGSPVGKVSGSSTSKGPGSVTSIKGSASSARSANPTRRGSYGGGINTTGRSRRAREGSMSSTKSRSRSRTGDGHSTALGPLVMTRATSGKGTGGKALRGRTGAIGRARAKPLSKTNEVVRESAEELKRALMFNFGSGSDGGSHPGSKSTGSGSELNVKQDGAPAVSNQLSQHQEMVNNSSRGGADNIPVIPEKMVEEKDFKGKEKGMVAHTDKGKGKGKGKEKAKSPTAKSSAVPTRVEATIADPLLPGSVRRQIVLTSDSEGFETETDIWSDTESADAPVSASQQRLQAQQQQQQQRRQQQQQEQQQQQPRPSLLTRTQSDNIPRNLKSRAHQRLTEQRVAEDRKWRDELFVKLPKSSFQDLAEVARTRSVGLLSQLLNPDPRRLPMDHPGRRGFSSGMIQPLRPFTPLAPVQQPNQHQLQQARPQPVAPVIDPSQIPPQPLPKAATPQTHQDAQPRQHSRQSSRNYQLPKRLAALTNSSTVGIAAKTPVASAVMSELRVGSISGTKQVTTGGVSINGSAGKYKPKARPPETVMEDTSDSENDDNQLDLSKSVAQEKLKALLEGKKMKKSGLSAVQASHDQDDEVGVYQFPSQPVEPISIPPPRLLYPYNLPAPNPPTTPRTTRRKMLTVEIPESLRRNLLWERQVSQAHPRGLKRRHSIGGVKGWHIPNVVKLTPKGVKPDEPEDKREENERRYLARTRSWAFEYHAVGW